MTLPKNLEVARQAKLRPLNEIAAEIGIGEHLLEPYGEGVAKIKLAAIEELADRPKAKYVVISAITPTPLGEGKTTTTVGLGQAFKHIGKTATVAVRQASMGPVFGIKGGAAGGGYSQVVPMEDLNLHLTGDIHAVTEAHNQLAAMIDNHLYQGNALDLELQSITWRRVMDVNDRALRNIVVGLGAHTDGVPRQTYTTEQGRFEFRDVPEGGYTLSARSLNDSKLTVEGVEAEGRRTTVTIPAGDIGNEQPIQIVDERWYSQELQAVVMTRRALTLDPRNARTLADLGLRLH